MGKTDPTAILGAVFITALLLAGGYLIFLAPAGGATVATQQPSGISGGATPTQPIATLPGCDPTQSQKVGAQSTNLDTGGSLVSTLNYSVGGAAWYAVSGSSTDSRNQQFAIDGLMNASPTTYFSARIRGTTPCESDATSWISRRLAANSSATISVINDNGVTANVFDTADEAIGSGGAATPTVTLKLDIANAYFTNPDLANFAITPYYLATSNISTSIYDKTQVDLTCLTSNCNVVEKSYGSLQADSNQNIVWKIEGNLHGAGNKAQFAFHLKAKSGQNPGLTNVSIQFYPVTWYKEVNTLNTINYGAEDAQGNLVTNPMIGNVYVD